MDNIAGAGFTSVVKAWSTFAVVGQSKHAGHRSLQRIGKA